MCENSFDKKFKGKFPLTVCRLTGKGHRAFHEYATRMKALLEASTPSRDT